MCPCGRTRCRHLSCTLNHPSTAAMRLMANYFDHLLSLDTPTYTVAQIAKRFEPSTVLWAFHTIQQSSLFLHLQIVGHCLLSPSVTDLRQNWEYQNTTDFMTGPFLLSVLVLFFFSFLHYAFAFGSVRQSKLAVRI